MNSPGLVLGAGIYIVIVDIAAVAVNAMWISFIVVSIIALFTGCLGYAELSSIYSKSAGMYFLVLLSIIVLSVVLIKR
jgi:amino acid transporter